MARSAAKSLLKGFSRYDRGQVHDQQLKTSFRRYHQQEVPINY